MAKGRCAIHSPMLPGSAIELLPFMLSTLIWFWAHALLYCLFFIRFVDGIMIHKKYFLLIFDLTALHPYLPLPMGLPWRLWRSSQPLETSHEVCQKSKALVYSCLYLKLKHKCPVLVSFSDVIQKKEKKQGRVKRFFKSVLRSFCCCCRFAHEDLD